eukprot:1434235-Rhodomonas_salina.2
MPPHLQPAFEGMASLNRVQSIVFPVPLYPVPRPFEAVPRTDVPLYPLPMRCPVLPYHRLLQRLGQ